MPTATVMLEPTMAVHWKLQELLDNHDLTAYRLSEATAGRLSRNAVYNLTSGAPTSVNFATLDALLTALRALTGTPLGVADLIEFRDPNESGAPTTAK